MDESKLVFDVKILKHFINNALGLSYEKHAITGYELLFPIMNASSHNTYIETVSDKADTLYRRAKESLTSMMTHAYLNYIKRLSEKFELKENDKVLLIKATQGG